MSRAFNRIKKIPSLCPGWNVLLLISVAVIVLQRTLRSNKNLMRSLSEGIIRPFHRFLSVICSQMPFSVAELLIAIAILIVATVLIAFLCRIVSGKKLLPSLYRLFVTLLAMAAFVYAGFCVLWGVYYYGETFSESSGLSDEEISVEQLKTVTLCFAGLANEYSSRVNRNERGEYEADFDSILEKSDQVFKNTEKYYEYLSGPDIRAKGIMCSRLLSYTGFTGFFFPFTGEANVNTDVESAYFASTVAHELSHQRGVATEQEANFVGIMASLNYGDADYVYSAALLAYCHLGNALYSADYSSWVEVYSKLNENVLRDYVVEEQYWKQFETPVEDVTDAVYENFLYSYDQELGLKSYGACVDLLVNFYYEQACEFLRMQ